MQHQRSIGTQKRLALWVVAAVVGLSVLSSVVLLFNPVDAAWHAQCAPRGADGQATLTMASARVAGVAS